MIHRTKKDELANGRAMVIDEHVSTNIRRGQYDNLHTLVNASGSAIAEHLIINSCNVFPFTF